MSIMKNMIAVTSLFFFLSLSIHSFSQEVPISPSYLTTGEYLGLSVPLRDAPLLTHDDYLRMQFDAARKRHEDLEFRSYPYAETALPQGPDTIWQNEMGKTSAGTRSIFLNLATPKTSAPTCRLLCPCGQAGIHS